MRTNEMKSLIFLGLIGSLMFTSCTKDGETTDIQANEAVEVIESALANESNGMSKTMSTTLDYATAQNVFTATPYLNCGQVYALSYNESYSASNYSYSYTAQRNALLNCDANGTRQSFTSNTNFSGNYSTPRMSSDDTIETLFSVTGLSVTNSNTIFNGNYTRKGTQVSKTRNNNSFSSTLTCSLNNINVNKTTYMIQSGSASVNFVGVSSSGNQYTFSGTITFSVNETATLVLNGNTYNINL
jgi:hypothetical protein